MEPCVGNDGFTEWISVGGFRGSSEVPGGALGGESWPGCPQYRFAAGYLWFAFAMVVVRLSSHAPCAGFSAPLCSACIASRSSFQLPPLVPFIDEHCTPSQAPVVDLWQNAHPSYDQIRERRNYRRYSRNNSKAVSITRVAAMNAEASKRAATEGRDMDASMSVLSKRGRPPVDVVAYFYGSQDSQDSRRRVAALRLALVSDKEVVIRSTLPPVAGGVGAAIFPGVAQGCSRV